MKKVFYWILGIVLICGGVFTACIFEDEPGENVQKTLLIILDGWGIGDKSKGDLITQTPTPYMDYLKVNYPHSELQASGEYVGLPDGQMGNSETGHLNIGAGRVVYQDLMKINRSIADNQNAQLSFCWLYVCFVHVVYFVLFISNSSSRESIVSQKGQSPL